jgi:hypothetical protein
MKAYVYLFVNGIGNMPSSAFEWTDEATLYLQSLGIRAEAYEYCTTFINRWIKQDSRVKNFAHKVQSWADKGFTPVLVGHSNGCDIIIKSLKHLHNVYDIELHLISAAAEPDFRKNGLNKALNNGQVKRCVIYIAGKDFALKYLASWSRKVLGWLGLGFQNLGYIGPRHVNPYIVKKLATVVEKDYHHSSWFSHENFPRTMRQVLS